MRKPRVLSMCLLMLASAGANAATVVVTTLGDAAGNCPSPTNCTLRAAIAAAAPNDRIEFDPALVLPATLALQGTELSINKNLTIVGPGADRLSVRAAAARRVLLVTSGSVGIERLELSGGRQFGMNGTSAPPGTGGAGLNGAPSEGGCVRTSPGTNLVLDRVSIRDCIAQGGNGGAGGSGVNASPAGNGGPGGTGGFARGGAIAADGLLTLVNSSIAGAISMGGAGGAGGTGGAGGFFSSDGNGGPGRNAGAAQGGALYVGSGGSLLIRNSTLLGNSANAGIGGRGGDGGDGSAVGIGAGGNGGSGASAQGGQVFLDTSLGLADLEFASLGPATMTAGLGGIGGAGDPPGNFGPNGSRSGESVFAATVPRIRSSVLVGNNAATDCSGAITASGNNADSDDSCAGFTHMGSFAANFRAPPVDTEGGRAVMLPISGSIAIDAAVDCIDLAGGTLTSDQSGRTRPLDGDGNGTAICDLGAVEFNYLLFANGFE